MKDSLAEFEYKGHTIRILQDEDAQNPRTEWDNMARMACFHRRYNLGDYKVEEKFGSAQWGFRSEDYDGWGAMEADIRKKEKPTVMEPLYLYDHSGITISTRGFSHGDSAGWDWGQVGFVWIPAAVVRKEFDVKSINAAVKKRAQSVLDAEVAVYDQYLRGECFGWRVNDPVDAGCWGYYLNQDERYDDEDNCMVVEAKHAIDAWLESEIIRKKRESDEAQKRMEKDFALTP